MRGKDITSLSLQFQEDNVAFAVDINLDMKGGDLFDHVLLC
jgi:hypothetical protein